MDAKLSFKRLVLGVVVVLEGAFRNWKAWAGSVLGISELHAEASQDAKAHAGGVMDSHLLCQL